MPASRSAPSCVLLVAASLLAAAIAASAAAAAQAATVVYVNRCAGGCTFRHGVNSARENSTPLLDGTRTLAPFAHGDAVFDATLACLGAALADYDLALATDDPGALPHLEIVLAGTPQDAGLPAGVPAIAPIGCAALPGAPAFVFANAAAPEPARLCWYALQQLGFLAGLEPLSHCPDAMSIQEGCGDKTLTDHESECGATFAQPCRCGGGTTRNAHRTMLEAFGRRPEVADVFGRADATSRAPR